MGLYLGEILIPEVAIITDNSDNNQEIQELIGKGEIE